MVKGIQRLAGILILGTCSLGVTAQTRPEDTLPPKYEKWLNEEVVYVITDMERVVFFRLKTDGDRDFFIESFWKARDPEPATALNEFKEEHYRRLAYANEHFSTPATPGWKTDMGKLYITTGGTFPKLRQGEEPTVRLRFFEGIKQQASPVPQSIASSYLRSTISASIESEADLDKERSHLATVFNLKEVRPLTEANINWPGEGEGNRIYHILSLDGKPYLFTLALLGGPDKRQFHVSIITEHVSDGKKTVLDTEIVLPSSNTAIFGFQNDLGQPYFLSLNIASIPASGARPGPDSLTIWAPDAPKETQAAFEKGAVRCSRLIPNPRLIKSIDPIYPEIAKQAKVEGFVALDLRIGKTGRVTNVLIRRSVPLLDQAAIDAVRQWVFEPLLVEGKAVDAIMTTAIGFHPERSMKGLASVSFGFLGEKIIKDAVIIEGRIPPPKCLKSVPAVYPEIAKQAKIEGFVILAVRTDKEGRVEEVKVLRSMPLLDQAAIDAVKQWVYEPLIKNGKPQKAVFAVTVGFYLD